jgi:hypothetical protein
MANTLSKNVVRKQTLALANAIRALHPEVKSVRTKASTIHKGINVLRVTRDGYVARIFLDFDAEHAIVQVYSKGDRGLRSFTAYDGESLFNGLKLCNVVL